MLVKVSLLFKIWIVKIIKSLNIKNSNLDLKMKITYAKRF